MTSEPGRFIRSPLKLEAEYTTVRNWWLRDSRITGNPLSLYLFILSHSVAYEITQDSARSALGLGRTAFTSARARLEEAGFLEVVDVRHPAGTVDADGRRLGGQIARRDLRLLDPVEPTVAGKKPDQNHKQVSCSGPESSQESPVDNFPIAASGERGQSDESRPGDQKPWSEPQAGFPSTDDPSTGDPLPGFVLLKEDQVKENQSSSSAVAIVTNPNNAGPGPAGSMLDDDDDFSMSGSTIDFEGLMRAGVDQALAEVDPRLDCSDLRRRLADTGLDPAAVDLPAAASAVLSAASRRVGNPAAYVARAIILEPARWPWQTLHADPPSSRRNDGGCVDRECVYADEWRAQCVRCGEERPGWRDERYGHANVQEVAR